jgi:hypothetical protein
MPFAPKSLGKPTRRFAAQRWHRAGARHEGHHPHKNALGTPPTRREVRGEAASTTSFSIHSDCSVRWIQKPSGPAS